MAFASWNIWTHLHFETEGTWWDHRPITSGYQGHWWLPNSTYLYLCKCTNLKDTAGQSASNKGLIVILIDCETYNQQQATARGARRAHRDMATLPRWSSPIREFLGVDVDKVDVGDVDVDKVTWSSPIREFLGQWWLWSGGSFATTALNHWIWQ